MSDIVELLNADADLAAANLPCMIAAVKNGIATARAASFTIQSLRARLAELEAENAALSKWVDEQRPGYSAVLKGGRS